MQTISKVSRTPTIKHNNSTTTKNDEKSLCSNRKSNWNMTPSRSKDQSLESHSESTKYNRRDDFNNDHKDTNERQSHKQSKNNTGSYK